MTWLRDRHLSLGRQGDQVDLTNAELVAIDHQMAFDIPPWPRRWNMAADKNGLELLRFWRHSRSHWFTSATTPWRLVRRSPRALRATGWGRSRNALLPSDVDLIADEPAVDADLVIEAPCRGVVGPGVPVDS